MTTLISRMVALTLFGLAAASSVAARDYLIEDGDVAGLIAAVHTAGESPEPDRIFLPSGGTFTFDRPWVEGGNTALPPVRGDVDVIGNGAVLRRYSADNFAHLAVAADGRLRIVDVTLSDGGEGAIENAGDLFAWGVTVEDSSGQFEASALLNLGSARLLDCDIRFNTFAGAGDSGGAVVNHGVLEIATSRLYGNTAFGGGVHPEFGAAVTNFGRATLNDVVVADNGTVAAPGRSGAIANFEPGRLLIRESVIEGNEPSGLAAVRSAGVMELSATRVVR